MLITGRDHLVKQMECLRRNVKVRMKENGLLVK